MALKVRDRVRKTKRSGKSVLVIDILYPLTDGTRERYRRDAQVQTMTSAREEARQLINELETTGRIQGARPFRRSSGTW